MDLLFQATPAPPKIIEHASAITEVAWNSIDGLLRAGVEKLPYILAALLVLGVFAAAARGAKWLFRFATRRTTLDPRLKILFARLVSVALLTLGFFTALSVVIPSFTFGNIIAGFGLTSVVIGFATKDIINNLLSGVMILWNRPFQIGDYLFMGTHQGKVEYIGVRATSLRKDDGEVILIPNGEMYSSALTIRGAGAMRRMNIKFSVGYNVDLDKAKELTATAMGKLDFIVKEPPADVYVTDLGNDGVGITANFWINTDAIQPRKAYDTASIAIMKELDATRAELLKGGSTVVRGVAADPAAPEPAKPGKTFLDL